MTIEGKDAEYWGGYYGPRFTDERLYIELETQSEEKNLLKRFGCHPINSDTGICSYFNLGFGHAYYLNGKQVISSPWSSHQEYDASLFLPSPYPYTAFSKNYSPFTCQLTLDFPHYVGGSSYLIRGSLMAEDIVEVPLQNIEIASIGKMLDVKVAFKMDYREFKDGEILLVLKS